MVAKGRESDETTSSTPFFFRALFYILFPQDMRKAMNKEMGKSRDTATTNFTTPWQSSWNIIQESLTSPCDGNLRDSFPDRRGGGFSKLLLPSNNTTSL